MENVVIRALLDKYFLAETSIEEEKSLAAYFRGPEVDPTLEPFRDLFAYFEEEAGLEAALTIGADFENKILERIAREEAMPPAEPGVKPPAGNPLPMFSLRHWFNPAYAAAAAVILSIGLFIMYQPSNHHDPYARTVTPAGAGAPVAAGAVIKDTYDDPQQALAAIRQALLTASTRMNQGNNITKKNMDRLKKLNYGQL